jgi:hypothetical protein
MCLGGFELVVEAIVFFETDYLTTTLRVLGLSVIRNCPDQMHHGLLL